MKGTVDVSDKPLRFVEKEGSKHGHCKANSYG